MIKQKLNEFLSNKITEDFIITVICLNFLLFILDTMSSFHQQFAFYVDAFETFSIIIFTIEYLLRVISLEKFTDIFKPLMLIDLFAIMPFYLNFLWKQAILLRLFRLSKILRIFKVTRYSNAINNIKNAFVQKKDELFITLSIFCCGILSTSILMYFAEHNAQPQVFSSIPKCLYFSIITFTSTGYGDVAPITNFGQIVACLSAVIGVGIHGLFIGILGTAFMRAFKND